MSPECDWHGKCSRIGRCSLSFVAAAYNLTQWLEGKRQQGNFRDATNVQTVYTGLRLSHCTVLVMNRTPDGSQRRIVPTWAKSNSQSPGKHVAARPLSSAAAAAAASSSPGAVRPPGPPASARTCPATSTRAQLQNLVLQLHKCCPWVGRWQRVGQQHIVVARRLAEALARRASERWDLLHWDMTFCTAPCVHTRSSTTGMVLHLFSL